MSKKSLVMWLAMLLTTFAVPLAASDFEAVNDDGKTIYYKILTETTCCVTYKGTNPSSEDEYSGEIVIPQSAYNPADGKTRSVTEVHYQAFQESSVEALVFQNGMTKINGSSTSGITGAKKLKRLVIPSTFVSNRYLLSGCGSVEEIEWNVPDYAGSSYYMVSNETRLHKIIFGEGVTVIPSRFCSGLRSLHTVVLPTTLDTIGVSAFYNCNEIFEIYNLSSHFIPVGSTGFGGVAKNAQKIHRTSGEPSIFGYEGNYEFALLNGVPTIHYYHYDNDTAISLPQSIEVGSRVYYAYSLGDNLFKNRKALKSVTFPKSGIRKIGAYAFYQCGLKGELKLPEQLTEIGDYAFNYCDSLKGELHLPETLTTIGEKAFEGLWLLSGELVIPEKVRTIGASAFARCRFDKVTVNSAKLDTWSTSFFSYSRVKELVWNVPQYVNTSKSSMVSCFDSLTTIVFGENVVSVPDYFAFHRVRVYVPRIDSVVFSDGIK